MGQFKNIPATQMGAAVARGAIESSGLQPSDIEENFFGCVLTAGMG